MTYVELMLTFIALALADIAWEIGRMRKSRD